MTRSQYQETLTLCYVFTEEQIEAWVAAAEAGYDVPASKKRRHGRLGGAASVSRRVGEDGGVSSYVRPAVEAAVFRDDSGRVIEYGNRWEGSPPEDTYSVDTHPERFAPLLAVADALIAHLCDTYDVRVEEGDAVLADLIHPPLSDVVRAVRMRPGDPACASLTMVMSAYPGVYLGAGVLHDFYYPMCGCDACDSTWQTEAERLEQQMLAVVTGHYRETLARREGDAWVGFAFTYPDGASSGEYRDEGMSFERYAAAESALRSGAGEWAAWPRRASV